MEIPCSKLRRRDATRSLARGFTMIELMVVVAIIVIIASIAIPIYLGYVREAQAAKLTDHYDSAIRTVRAEFTKRLATLSRPGSQLDPLTADYLVTRVLDADGAATAPLGGPAYVPGPADGEAGAIGVTVNSGGRAGTEVVTISRPAFLDTVAAENVVIYANSIR